MTRIDGVLYPSPGELELYRFYSLLKVSRVALWCHDCGTTMISDLPPDTVLVAAMGKLHYTHSVEAVTTEMEDLVNPGWRDAKDGQRMELIESLDAEG